jgi:flagellar M-ring protein FliF
VQNLVMLWSSLSARRQLVVLGAALAALVAVFALVRVATTPSMSLLYAGLDPASAGEVVRALEQQGTVFEIRGDSIWVDARARDMARMALAADGLPANAGAGYELLDGLSGFGTTAQMFDAAYLRAKEGELARTISAAPHVRTARVHVAQPPSQPFRRDSAVTASVTVTTVSGGLTTGQAQAIRHLVAASVAGLAVEDVAVIDSVAGLIPASDQRGAAGGDERLAEMRRNVERLLAARVGAGRALVELSVDINTEAESISERRFDPQSRVAISTDTEEKSSSSTGSGPGVTVASNLPEGDAAQGDTSRAQSAESRERVNFEVSQTSRELRRDPGGIRRLTVAVLVDGLRAPDGSWSPRSDAELADLRDLVASAVGFDAERGDVITLKSMELQGAEVGAAPALAGWLDKLDVMSLVQLLVLAFVALALGLFVIRPIFLSGRAQRGPDPAALPAPSRSLGAPQPTALDGVIDGDAVDLPGARLVVAPDTTEAPPDADPVDRLRRLISERQTESVEILRNWMEEREETRG